LTLNNFTEQYSTQTEVWSDGTLVAVATGSLLAGLVH